MLSIIISNCILQKKKIKKSGITSEHVQLTLYDLVGHISLLYMAENFDLKIRDYGKINYERHVYESVSDFLNIDLYLTKPLTYMFKICRLIYAFVKFQFLTNAEDNDKLLGDGLIYFIKCANKVNRTFPGLLRIVSIYFYHNLK